MRYYILWLVRKLNHNQENWGVGLRRGRREKVLKLINSFFPFGKEKDREVLVELTVFENYPKSVYNITSEAS